MATTPFFSRVQRKGQVTIPQELREKYGIAQGDFVSFRVTEEGILISPQEIVVRSLFEKMGTMLKEEGITLEQLMEDGRDIRGEIVKEKYGLSDEGS